MMGDPKGICILWSLAGFIKGENRPIYYAIVKNPVWSEGSLVEAT
jgi:hypothetical protein